MQEHLDGRGQVQRRWRISNAGSLQLTGRTITNDRTGNGAGIGYHAPGITEDQTITNCTISGNVADNDGGGIVNFGTPPVVIKNTTFTGSNQARLGGGLYNRGNIVTFDRASRVTNNSAADAGGDTFNIDAVTALNGAAVSGNTPHNCAGPAPVAVRTG